MKLKITSLIVALIFVPWSLFLTYRILTIIGADELTWFIYWLLIPIALASATLSKLAEWEE